MGDLARTKQSGARDLAAVLARGVAHLVMWFFTGGLAFPLPDRRQIAVFALTRLLFVGVVLYLWSWAVHNPGVAFAMLGGLFGIGLYAFAARAHAREEMLFVASRALDAYPPLSSRTVNAPRLLDARSLQQLAFGVDRLRRGDVHGALDAVRDIEEGRLQVDEKRMLSAVRALAAEATGDKKHAAVLSLDAFPTGAPPIDERIGKVCIEGAWFDGVRLSALLDAWRVRGIDVDDPTELGALVRFASVKLARIDPGQLSAEERRLFAARARQLGDRETERLLALSLPDPTTYR